MLRLRYFLSKDPLIKTTIMICFCVFSCDVLWSGHVSVYTRKAMWLNMSKSIVLVIGLQSLFFKTYWKKWWSMTLSLQSSKPGTCKLLKLKLFWREGICLEASPVANEQHPWDNCDLDDWKSSEKFNYGIDECHEMLYRHPCASVYEYSWLWLTFLFLKKWTSLTFVILRPFLHHATSRSNHQISTEMSC